MMNEAQDELKLNRETALNILEYKEIDYPKGDADALIRTSLSLAAAQLAIGLAMEAPEQPKALLERIKDVKAESFHSDEVLTEKELPYLAIAQTVIALVDHAENATLSDHALNISRRRYG